MKYRTAEEQARLVADAKAAGREVVYQTEYPHGTPVDAIFTFAECEARRKRLAWEATLRKLRALDQV